MLCAEAGGRGEPEEPHRRAEASGVGGGGWAGPGRGTPVLTPQGRQAGWVGERRGLGVWLGSRARWHREDPRAGAGAGAGWVPRAGRPLAGLARPTALTRRPSKSFVGAALSQQGAARYIWGPRGPVGPRTRRSMAQRSGKVSARSNPSRPSAAAQGHRRAPGAGPRHPLSLLFVLRMGAGDRGGQPA